MNRTLQCLTSAIRNNRGFSVSATNAKTGRRGLRYSIEVWEKGVSVYQWDSLVIFIRRDDSMILNNCGYFTKTTKNLINAVLNLMRPGMEVTQVKGDWYLNGVGWDGNDKEV